MTIFLALPKAEDLPAHEIGATFVVPAPNGCNLDCPFCFIRMRREANPAEVQLDERDYTDFLEQLNLQTRVSVVSLQGYEPLLPESWSYSEALLRRARELGIEATLVTNGTLLADRISDLADLGVGDIAVSVDSADPAIHDRSRGTPGAFAATLRGLEAACASGFGDRILVSSVLKPGKAQYLHTMPRLLNRLGVRRWAVNPLYNVHLSKGGGLVDRPESILFNLIRLNDMASENGVQLVVDDDFRLLSAPSSGLARADALLTRQLWKFDQLVRLSPNGSCSVGRDILRRADTGLAVWNPDREPASAFVGRMIEERIDAPTLA